MKKSKSILAMLLACMLLALTACGGADSSSGSGTENSSSGGSQNSGPEAANTNVEGSGRYVETDITPDGETILDMLQLSDGTVVLFTEGLTARYDSKDGGKTFTKSEWPGVTDGSLQHVRSLSVTDDGTVYGVKSDPAGGADTLIRVTPEGVVETVPNEALEAMTAAGKIPSIHTLQALSEDKILLGIMDSGNMVMSGSAEEGGEGETGGSEENTETAEIEDAGESSAGTGGVSFSVGGAGENILGVFNPDTGSKYYDLLDTMGFLSSTVYGGNLYLFGYDSGVSIRSLETGKEVGKLEEEVPETEENTFSFSMGRSTLAQDGQVYTQDSKGVYKQGMETGAKTKVFDGAAHSFGFASNMVMRFYTAPEDAFVMLVQESGGTKVYRYAYDANAVADPDKVLDIWALEDSGTLRAAISSFLKNNPDATVNLTIGKDEQGAKETADIIQNLNTKILAGDGPDILLLDGLPAASYAEKGMLLDLKQLMDFSETYEQLLTPLETDGSLYYFPSRFKTALLLTTADQLSSFSDLESMVTAIENGKDKPAMSADTSDPFGAISQEERPVFEFTDFNEVFESLYPASAGKIIESGGLNLEAVTTFLSALKRICDKYKLMDGSEDGAGSVVVMMSGGSDAEAVTGNVISYMSGRALSGSFLMGSLSYLSLFESDGTEYTVMPGLTEGSYLPGTMMGINAGTDQAELAAAFLQHMLTEDVQGVFGGGFPMTQKGFDAQLKELSETEVYGMETGTVSFDMQSFISRLRTPVITDQVVMGAVKEAARAYCEGTIELDAAVSQAEEATRLYLAEQS